MTSRNIICCAYPFGYGPAAKLLYIARGLRKHKQRLVFLGSGIAHELVARSDLFDEIVTAAPGEERSRALIRDSAAVLSVMNRDYSALAVELGRPLFIVDSLLWMRDQIPTVFRNARRYWAQNFADDHVRLPEAGPNAVVVGPILGPEPAVPQARRTRIVINLGGGQTFDGMSDMHLAYIDFVLRVLRIALPTALRRGAVLLAGERCVRYFRESYPNCGLEILSASHDEMLRLLRTAKWVITAPGLTTCLECFQARVPTFFLPPQNYSQWWILNKLRERSLAPGSVHWQDLLPDYPITERMPEDVRGPLVRDAIHRLASDHRAEQRLGTGLADILQSDGRDLGGRQRAFFDSRGLIGTGQIVNELLAMNEESRVNHQP